MSQSSPLLVLHLCAPNDRNGNPRRLYLLIAVDTGAVFAIVDEGYSGRGAIPAVWRKWETLIDGPEINITASEYTDWKKNPTYQ